VPVRHWARDPALRSWPVLLLVALVCVPPIGLVMLNNQTEARIHEIAWIFAAYFAVAWLLLLGVIVRPQHVSRSMLAAIAVIGIVTQAPTAIFLETKLHSSTGNLLDVFTIGIPEELAKAIPIVVVAWIWRHYWHTQTPRDYLFLGAVSGLVFGAAEAVHYFTNVLGSLSGNVNGLDLQDLTIQYIWRFLTDPIDHAMWAGITGYFIGLAITGQNRKYSLGLIGIAIAAVAQPLYDAVYGELTLPTNLTDPFLYRVATQAAVPLIAVTIAWLACETVAAVAVRRLVVAGSGFWASLGGALLQLVCRPFTSIATVATTTLVSIAAIGLVMLGTGLAFDLCLQAARLPNPVALTFSLGPIAGSRDLRPLVFLAAALVLGAAWTAGLAIAGIASAWRSAAWTGETAAASGRVMTPVLSAESTRAASPGSIPPRHTADL
jgi:RsiW-degrading membrane proteinase PrsW (M82 family)